MQCICERSAAVSSNAQKEVALSHGIRGASVAGGSAFRRRLLSFCVGFFFVFDVDKPRTEHCGGCVCLLVHRTGCVLLLSVNGMGWVIFNLTYAMEC